TWPITMSSRFDVPEAMLSNRYLSGRSLENKKTPLSGFYYSSLRFTGAFLCPMDRRKFDAKNSTGRNYAQLVPVAR
ncbi:MAG: hypothetical protein AB2615_15465, partial [Candidatus Thiodiazotropha sp.]